MPPSSRLVKLDAFATKSSSMSNEIRFFARVRGDPGAVAPPLRVRSFERPYAPFHDTYQRYYSESLQRYCSMIGADFRALPLSRFPRALRALKWSRDKGYAKRLGVPRLEAVIGAVASLLEGPADTPSGYFHNVTGQYLALLPDGDLRRFSIDAQDSPAVGSEDLRAWSDVYFKTNYWPDLGYPSNVLPLINADPFVLPKIAALRTQRDTAKRVDLSFVVRVWGGADEIEGIEHNLRLLEAVNRTRCSKEIIAVLIAGDMPKIRRRLERAGIRSTRRGLSSRQLWRLAAQSRLNLFRLGIHYCVPWRMTGSLAIGSCIVIDRPPFSRWPQPLREGVNFLSLGTEVGPGVPVAPAVQYEEIPERIENWLAQPMLLSAIAGANADYFDTFIDPLRLGAHLVEAVAPGSVGER